MDDTDVYRSWETITGSIKILAEGIVGYYKLKHNKPWFDERCSKLFDLRKEAKLQWLQYPSQINVDNVNSIRR
jgi:hypothetical protein